MKHKYFEEKYIGTNDLKIHTSDIVKDLKREDANIIYKLFNYNDFVGVLVNRKLAPHFNNSLIDYCIEEKQKINTEPKKNVRNFFKTVDEYNGLFKHIEDGAKYEREIRGEGEKRFNSLNW